MGTSMTAKTTNTPSRASTVSNNIAMAVPIAVVRLVRCSAISWGTASLINTQATASSTAILAMDLSSSVQLCAETIRASPVIGFSFSNFG
ncbi:hypothetical protein D3C77_271060 [compost metagenome]